MSYAGDNMSGVRKNNRSAVLRALHEAGGLSRKRLAEELKLTPAAITHITAELLSEGLLREGASVKGDKAGRREVLLQVDPGARIALGVLLNTRIATLSAATLDGTVLFAETEEPPLHASAEETVKRLSDILRSLVEAHHLPKDRIIGLGIAVRGVTGADGRTVKNSFGALDTRDYPLADRFETLTGYPTVLSNNVRALFGAETFLRKSTYKAEFFMRCEYGIGAALSVNGRIFHGVTEQCAEIGHIPVISRGGKLCSCGKSGCLETVASPAAIREDALAVCSPETTPVLYKIVRKKTAEAVTIEDVFRAAGSGDGPVQDIVGQGARHLGYALKSVIYTLDPGRITLYGRMFEDAYFLNRLLSEVSDGVDPGHAVRVEKSAYNLKLEPAAAPLVAVDAFFENGGVNL